MWTWTSRRHQLTQTSGTAPTLAAPDAAAAAGVPGRWRDVARAANLLDAAGTVGARPSSRP